MDFMQNPEHASLKGQWCPLVWWDPVKRKKTDMLITDLVHVNFSLHILKCIRNATNFFYTAPYFL